MEYCSYCGVTLDHRPQHLKDCPNAEKSPLDYISIGGEKCGFCGVPKGHDHMEGCQELHRPKPLKPKEKLPTVSAFDRQVGGLHYKSFAIEPLEFMIRNKLSFTQGNIIKRICRYNLPGGKGLEDLEKIIHEIQCLIEIETKE